MRDPVPARRVRRQSESTMDGGAGARARKEILVGSEAEVTGDLEGD